MAQHTVYFALGFGLPGCMPNGSTAYAVSTRRDMVAAIEGECRTAYEARNAKADLGINNVWAFGQRAKSLSCISRELSINAGPEVLMFMGLTEDEYNSHQNEEW